MTTNDRPNYDLCKHLRWKTQSRDSDDPRAVLESLARSQVPFSCLHTCQPWGPDDDLVAPERCCASRGCFEQSANAGGGARLA